MNFNKFLKFFGGVPKALHVLPVASAPPAQLSAPNPPETMSAPDVVLIVEDDVTLAGLFGVLVQRCGLRVRHAADAQEARSLFAAHTSEIALVVMDCGLPDSSDGGLGREIRAMSPRLPILLTSGRPQEGLHRLLAVDGPAAFLPKPFFVADVARHLRALLPSLALA